MLFDKILVGFLFDIAKKNFEQMAKKDTQQVTEFELNYTKINKKKKQK